MHKTASTTSGFQRWPDPDEEAAIRALAEAAGGREALAAWIGRVLRERPPWRPVGSSRLNERDFILIGAAREACSRSGMLMRTALRLQVDLCWSPEWGASKKATVHRLMRKASTKTPA
jgi:hypothetical protein